MPIEQSGSSKISQAFESVNENLINGNTSTSARTSQAFEAVDENLIGENTLPIGASKLNLSPAPPRPTESPGINENTLPIGASKLNLSPAPPRPTESPRINDSTLNTHHVPSTRFFPAIPDFSQSFQVFRAFLRGENTNQVHKEAAKEAATIYKQISARVPTNRLISNGDALKNLNAWINSHQIPTDSLSSKDNENDEDKKIRVRKTMQNLLKHGNWKSAMKLKFSGLQKKPVSGEEIFRTVMTDILNSSNEDTKNAKINQLLIQGIFDAATAYTSSDPNSSMSCAQGIAERLILAFRGNETSEVTAKDLAARLAVNETIQKWTNFDLEFIKSKVGVPKNKTDLEETIERLYKEEIRSIFESQIPGYSKDLIAETIETLMAVYPIDPDDVAKLWLQINPS